MMALFTKCNLFTRVLYNSMEVLHVFFRHGGHGITSQSLRGTDDVGCDSFTFVTVTSDSGVGLEFDGAPEGRSHGHVAVASR